MAPNWILSIEGPNEKIEESRQDYNEFRPHRLLEDLTPRQTAAKYKADLGDQNTPEAGQINNSIGR